jgi:dTDP-4-dehydrorhamnose 3,5-epimerase
MNVIKTDIPNLLLLEPKVFNDNRGYFFESYSKQKLDTADEFFDFIQDNQSKSSYGVVRGLHYQLAPYAQTKLVRVLQGTILDVAVDLRKGSPTFGKSFSIELSAENFKQLLIPKGFAHGFSVLSETAVVLYKCDAPWNKEAERGIIFNDDTLNIDWGIPNDKILLSEKDIVFPKLKEADINFIF